MNKVTTKPYLIRAIYEWCIDQGYTPHIAVMVDRRAHVPAAYVRDGQIVLNLAPEATHQLTIGNDVITFQARFGGVAFPLSIPIENVIAVYARENGQGMAFEPEPAPDESEIEALEAPEVPDSDDGTDAAGEAEKQPSGAPRAPAERGGHLKIVK